MNSASKTIRPHTLSLSILWRRFRHSDIPTAALFLLPAVVILGVFSFYPIGSALRLSLFKWDNLAPVQTFVGLDNYVSLFQSSRFWNSMLVTLEYTVGVTAVSLAGGLWLVRMAFAPSSFKMRRRRSSTLSGTAAPREPAS